MSYDERIAERIRRALHDRRGITEKKMFGGIAFLSRGRMFCGVLRDDLVVRVGPDRHETALARPGTRPMDFTGRPMKGFVYVAPRGCRTARDLRRWIEDGLAGSAIAKAKGRKRKLGGKNHAVR